MIIEDLKLWRGSLTDKRLVVTNGCFDILHAGHVHYLSEAKSFGDYLLVGINSDSSIKKLKGKSRPINPQSHRAYVLDNLKCVDFVYVFNELRCTDFLKISQPDIYVKGGDYALDTLNNEEKQILIENKSDIKFIKFKFDISTTNILSKI
jgi:D-beta-D-heptose 7-phosphate kinase/D-beta-D-heptose 1-phosphate adenosyltransferase